MKTIYYVRHGLTDANAAGIASGGEHEAELTDEGRDQARRAGRDLANNKIDLIVCSSMKRTIETAEIIAKEIGYDKDKIIPRKEFIERLMGPFSGNEQQVYSSAIQKEGINAKGLETVESLKKRVEDGFQWLKTLDATNVILVSHGGTGRIIRAINEDLKLHDAYMMEGFKNSEIYKFELQPLVKEVGIW